jgi:PhoH-like ATPase
MTVTGRHYVVDTNVLLHEANALNAFADGEVVLTVDVLEELDQFKSKPDELGRASRRAVRILDRLRARGALADGILLDNGGTLRVVMTGFLDDLPANMDRNNPDNRIIACALHLQNAPKGEVVFVSKDLNARVKATALGLTSIDYAPDAPESLDELYRGFREHDVPREQIDAFYQTQSAPAPDGLMPNEFVLLRDESNPKQTALTRNDPASGTLQPLRFDESRPWKLSPLNMGQRRPRWSRSPSEGSTGRPW